MAFETRNGREQRTRERFSAHLFAVVLRVAVQSNVACTADGLVRRRAHETDLFGHLAMAFFKTKGGKAMHVTADLASY